MRTAGELEMVMKMESARDVQTALSAPTSVERSLRLAVRAGLVGQSAALRREVRAGTPTA